MRQPFDDHGGQRGAVGVEVVDQQAEAPGPPTGVPGASHANGRERRSALGPPGPGTLMLTVPRLLTDVPLEA